MAFACCEPEDAWCRQNASGPREEQPEDSNDCWFTYSGVRIGGLGRGRHLRPTELRLGAIEFTKSDDAGLDY